MQCLKLLHAGQRAAVGIGHGQGLTLAHPLALGQGVAQRSGVGVKGLLTAHQIAVQLHGDLLCGGVDQGGVDGVGEIAVRLHGEVDHHRRQNDRR